MLEKISQVAEQEATNVSQRQVLGRFAGAATATAILLTAPATAQTYTAIDLYTLSTPSGFDPLPHLPSDGGVAANGQVIGWGGLPDSIFHALLWSAPGGAVTDMHPLSGFDRSLAVGIDGAKQVGVGRVEVNDDIEHALLWSGTAASAVDLHPTGMSGIRSSFAYGISGAQQVGFASFSDNLDDAHALLWTGTPSSAVDLHPSGFTNSFAYGTDGNHQVGDGDGHALLWSGTAASAVDLHPTHLSDGPSFALGTSGTQQVGVAFVASGSATGGEYHALLWRGTADSATDLHPTDLSGFASSRADHTNGVHQVGWAVVDSYPAYAQAMLWSGTANSAIDLHLLLPAGFTYSEARRIDAQGNVFGIAYDAAGNFHVVKWAVPEPSSLLLLIVAGSVALLARRGPKVSARFACYLAFVCAFAACQAHAVTIPTVPVGNPGNPADTRYVAIGDIGLGSVGYTYRIGTTEVTNAQYTEFLNGVDPTGANTLGLYNDEMTSDIHGGINFNTGAANGFKYEFKPGRDNNPVVYVSWYDSIRFANWLHNGQGAGNTENGAYTLLGGTPTPSNGLSITRNAGARWFLPSEDEWYKAAYHKNEGITGNYWDYPTSTDIDPNSDQPPGSDAPDPSNTGNFFEDDGAANGYNDGYAVTGSDEDDDSQNYLTDIGAYTLSTSPYGTFDQGGNVWEWNEALLRPFRHLRGLRGSSWYDMSSDLRASTRYFAHQTFEPLLGELGFRVASIPEPDDMPGDFNRDGIVNAADYVVWRKGLGTTHTQNDYNTWRAHFGQTAGSGVGFGANAAVPEPANPVLLLIGILSTCSCRRAVMS